MRQALFMESEVEAKIKLSLFYFDILHIFLPLFYFPYIIFLAESDSIIHPYL